MLSSRMSGAKGSALSRGACTAEVERANAIDHSAVMRIKPLAALILFVPGACSSAPTPAPRVAAAPPPAVSASSAPQPVPQPQPPAPAPAPRSVDWRDWPVTPGEWVYRQDGRGSIALFGTRGADAELTLRCDRLAATVYLSRRGGSAPLLTLRTTSLTRSLAMQPTGGSPAYLAAALSPRDPLLDAMGFSRGRFVIEAPGAPPLVVPAWAEILRVVEDCRR